MIIGIIFAFSGYKINNRIRRYFWEFYIENRKYMWFATIGLSIPIFLRGLVDFMRYVSEDFDE